MFALYARDIDTFLRYACVRVGRVYDIYHFTFP